ncbi:Peroxisomal hydratase-dehydrogenase-epimerase [Balamuthia mandrillaris]
MGRKDLAQDAIGKEGEEAARRKGRSSTKEDIAGKGGRSKSRGKYSLNKKSTSFSILKPDSRTNTNDPKKEKKKKKKKEKKKEATTATTSVAGKRITLCFFSTKEAEEQPKLNKRIIRCPSQWQLLMQECQNMVEAHSGREPGGELTLCLGEGGGVIHSLDLIEAGDELFIYSHQPSSSFSSLDTLRSSDCLSPPEGESHSYNAELSQFSSVSTSPFSATPISSRDNTLSEKTGGFVCTPSSPSSLEKQSKNNSVNSVKGKEKAKEETGEAEKGRENRTNSYSSNSSSNPSSGIIPRTWTPPPYHQWSSFNKNTDMEMLYRTMRTIPPVFEKAASSAASPSSFGGWGTPHFCGFFCAEKEEMVTQHLNQIADDPCCRTERGRKLSEEYLQSITSFSAAAHPNLLETLTPLQGYEYEDCIAVSCGSNTVAAITKDGMALMSGPKVLHYACLGRTSSDKSQTSDLTITPQGPTVSVRAISVQNSIRGLASGPLHSAAFTKDNEVITWGYNINTSLLGIKAEQVRQKLLLTQEQQQQPTYDVSGQLGTGRSDQVLSAPSSISGNLSGELVAISAGGAHTVALTSNGCVWSWGLNDEGQLGHQSNHLVPHHIKFFTAKMNVKRIACGAHHSVAVTADGMVYSWGYNEHGQLGIDSTLRCIFEPTCVETLQEEPIMAIACGDRHTAAVSASGLLYTWGANDYFQLGRKTFKTGPTNLRQLSSFKRGERNMPTKVSLRRNMRVMDASCGPDSTAIISAEGLVLVCGKLMGEGMTCHAPVFRLLNDILERNMFVSRVSCGNTHLAFIEDRQLTYVLHLFTRACAFMSFSMEDLTTAFRSIPPFFLHKIQYRALKQISRNSKRPKLSVECSFVQFRSKETISSVTVVNGSKEKMVVTPSLSSSSLPEGVTLRFDPPKCKLKGVRNLLTFITLTALLILFGLWEQERSETIQVILEGSSERDIFTFFNLVAHHPKRKDSVQCFIIAFIAGKDFMAMDGNSHASKAVAYAKERLDVMAQSRQQRSISREDSSSLMRKKSVGEPSPTGAEELYDSPQSTTRRSSSASKYKRSKEAESENASPCQQQQQNFADAEVVLFEKLGSGGSGAVVYRCSANGFTCAVKILDVEESTKEMLDGFLREIHLLESLRHHSVVRCLGHDVTLSKIRLFMEFYQWNLAKIIKKQREKRIFFSMKEVLRLSKLIVSGLNYLHSQNPAIIHRDLKPGNVLVALDEQGQIKEAKITDFDVSIELTSSQEACTMAGTPHYAAPEVLSLERKGYNVKADIFSFGMLLFEVLSLQQPFYDVDVMLVPHLVEQGKLPTLPEEVQQRVERERACAAVAEVMQQCLAMNPTDRPSSSMLLSKLAQVEADFFS